jgi:ABC-type uncharacterized transport system YnjBCD substrate-binding protein
MLSVCPHCLTTKAWKKLEQAYEKLKAFNKNVTFTPGNAGTLDMLSRGEITMGPVWVDMFYSWKDQGKLPPSIKLTLLSPGMPGNRCTTSPRRRRQIRSLRVSLSSWHQPGRAGAGL